MRVAGTKASSGTMIISAAGPPIGFVSSASSAHRAAGTARPRVQPRRSFSSAYARAPRGTAISSTSGLPIALAWLTIGSSE